MKLITLCKRLHAHTSTGRNVSPCHRDKDYGNWNKNEPVFKLPVFISETRGGSSRFTAQQISKRNMEILVFGLIAMPNGYRQQRETFVREPDEFQPFDVRALAA